jgi:GNAT superfamily N-acetyltransferase
MTGSAEALIAACADVFGRWGVTRQHADGELPVPGVYGVPEQWPHIAALYRRAGFTHTGHTEVVYLAQVKDLPSADAPPLDGLAVRRSVGINGCRFSAVLGEEVIGYIETEVLDKGERMSRHGGWADVGNLHVASPHRRRGVGSWLLGQAADWLRLAGANRLLNTAWLEGTDPGGRLPGVPVRRGLPRADPHRTRMDQGVIMHQADQVAIELTVAIKGGDVPALKRLLAARPGLASERITGRKGGTSTPLHIVTDWPGYFRTARPSCASSSRPMRIPMPLPPPASGRRRCTTRPAATMPTWPTP